MEQLGNAVAQPHTPTMPDAGANAVVPGIPSPNDDHTLAGGADVRAILKLRVKEGFGVLGQKF
jgi:hypothetical protein